MDLEASIPLNYIPGPVHTISLQVHPALVVKEARKEEERQLTVIEQIVIDLLRLLLVRE